MPSSKSTATDVEFAYRPELWQPLFDMVALAAVTLTGLLSVALSINLRTVVVRLTWGALEKHSSFSPYC